MVSDRIPPHLPTLPVVLVAVSACSGGVVGEPLGQEGAHEHGVAAVSMVVEGAEANVVFRAPSGDLWGFERPPRTDEEVDVRSGALASLEDGLIAALGLDARLGCSVDTVRWSGAAIVPPDPRDSESSDESTGTSDHDHDHDHDATGSEEEHVDGHQHEDDHDDQDHGTDDHDHGSSAEAEFEISCDAPISGTQLVLDFSSLFETIERVDLQVVSESQQFGRRVAAAGTRIGL